MKRIISILWLVFKSSLPSLIIALLCVGFSLLYITPSELNSLEPQISLQWLIFCFYFLFLTCSSIIGKGWQNYLFQKSKSKRHFWITILCLSLINLCLSSVGIFILMSLNDFFNIQKFAYSFADIFWIFLLAITASLIPIDDNRALIARGQPRNFSKAILTLGLCVLFISGFLLFLVNRFLAYFYFNFLFLAWFFNFNYFAINSFTSKVRKKTLIFFSVCLAALAGVSHLIATDYANSRQPGDIKSVSNARQWIQWFNSLNSKEVSAESIIDAFKKLEKICPPVPRDEPLKITCFEKNVEASFTFLKLHPATESLLDFLNSESEYVRLVGLVKARHEEKYSDAVQKKITEIANSPGLLSPIAQVTLKFHGKKKFTLLKLELKSIDTTPEN